jgi:phosphoribosylformylglycinamidine cyclo-ligase
MTDRTKAYAEAGVSLKAADELVGKLKSIAGATYTQGVISDIGGFGGLYKPNLKDMEEPVLVASTDGVGTKVKLASAFDKHHTVGIDLVAMSANDVLVQGARPLFFLDYLATGKLDPDKVAEIVSGVAEGCRQSQCALLGGETAEMPDMYAPGEYDLAGFCVGLADNQKIVDGSSVRVGDVLIGLASSGLHSNGYSLVRKTVDKEGLDPEEIFPGTKKKVWEVLLEPTALYVQPVLNLLRDFEIKAMVHVTGGGFYDNIPRILPKGVKAKLDFCAWTTPRVFLWLKKAAELSWPEMFQIFNCGIGFILIVDKATSEDILTRLSFMKQKAWVIGEAVRRGPEDEEQVEIVFPSKSCD